MPVRIYDISKKLGLQNKEIIAKAKSLGIAAARVPSSSLDKITAEDLENHLLEDHPELAAKFAAPPVVETPKPAPIEEKVVFITAPPPEPPKPEVKEEPPKLELTPPPVVEAPNRHRHRPNRLDRRLAKKSGLFNCRHARRAATKPPRPKLHHRGPGFPEDRAPGRASVRPAAVKPRRPPANRRSLPPPRRRPNLSRLRPAKSSSSNHRLSCANSPRNSSRSRSKSSPI